MVGKKGSKTCKMARDVIAKQQQLGITQRAVAREIGVCPAVIRRLTVGGKVRNASKKKVMRWLGEHPRQVKMFDQHQTELVVDRSDPKTGATPAQVLAAAAIEVRFGVPAKDVMAIIRLAESLDSGLNRQK